MKRFFLSTSFLCAFFALSAQLSVERPIKSEEVWLAAPVPFLEVEEIDVQSLLREDEVESRKDVPLRFGKSIAYNIDVVKNANHMRPLHGGMTFRMGISAKGAKSINLIFSKFDLTENSWMHIYDPQKKYILGAFTEANESENHLFATTVLPVDSLIIEIYDPTGSAKNVVELGEVIYGYRDWNETAEQFGASGGCNINVACPEGNAWRDQIRSIVMIVTGSSNNRICSGTMINNVREDGRAWMLTANHCPVSNSNVVIFNYQSNSCDPSEDSTFNHAINGIDIKATWSVSDFVLAELSSPPPASFNTYYSGWNNTGDVPREGVGIHHPRGDVKKISFDFDPSLNSGYFEPGNTHWQVEAWELGTTEVISSGSPLYNEERRIVGQLHGGDASCQEPEEEDYYGKFSYSWNTDPDSIRQLKYWLDPDNTGASSIGGFDPNISQPSEDFANYGFLDLNSELCGNDSIAPIVLVKNRGSLDQTFVEINFYVNNVLVHTELQSIFIGGGQVVQVLSKPFFIPEGIHQLRASIVPDIGDADRSNQDAITEIRVVKNPREYELVLRTDNSGSEISWNLSSNLNKVIYEGGGYSDVPGGETIRDTFCLEDGCFNFNMFDSFGDGLCCGFGNGFYLIIDLNSGDTLIQDFDFNGSDTSHFFCLGDTCNIRARADIRSSGFNDEEGSIELEMISGFQPFTFAWSNGALTQNIYDLNPASYNVRIEDSLGCIDSLFFEVPISTSIAELQNSAQELSIYPNPSSGEIFLRGISKPGLYKIKVFDSTSRLMMEDQSFISEKDFNLNLGFVPPGLYYVMIEGRNALFTGRVLIQ